MNDSHHMLGKPNDALDLFTAAGSLGCLCRSSQAANA